MFITIMSCHTRFSRTSCFLIQNYVFYIPHFPGIELSSKPVTTSKMCLCIRTQLNFIVWCTCLKERDSFIRGSWFYLDKFVMVECIHLQSDCM